MGENDVTFCMETETSAAAAAAVVSVHRSWRTNEPISDEDVVMWSGGHSMSLGP